MRLALLICAGVLSMAGTAQAADSWRALQRPLDLPSVAAGAPCPVSSVDTRVDWRAINTFGDGVGRGPAYPGLSENATVTLRSAGDIWLRSKVFWYVKPSYRGRVLVRGQRLDAPGSLRFDNGEQRLSHSLRIRPGQSVKWDRQPEGSRGLATAVRATAAGCYGMQIDGTNFTRTVVFRAKTG